MEFSLPHTTAILSRTPRLLRALLAGLPEGWTRGDEGPETFSPFEVVGHLIDGEETDWIPRARLILAGDPTATFTPFDRFRHRTRSAGRTIEGLLDEFERLRAGNLEIVEGWDLGAPHLAFRATHPSLGVVTLRQLLATWAVHDLGHIAQVTRVMAKQYAGEVGPWKAYLPVLSDRT